MASAVPAEPREIELKLELASGRANDLLGHRALRHAKPLPDKSGVLLAAYYDTPDGALSRAGLSLRLRDRNGRHVQTVKAERTGASLALDRSEWEHPSDGGLALEAIACTPLGPLLADQALRDRLRPVFLVETERQAFEIEREGTCIEVALDNAKVKAGEKTERFAEMELELVRGEASMLFALARDLADAAPLRLSTVTKSERGYRLLGIAEDAAFHAGPVLLPPGTACAAAFQVVARSCVAQIVRNEPLVRRDRNAEALHQMRVGLRRLKAARALFRPMLEGREHDAVKADMRWIGRKLGHVRDLDVYVDRLHHEESDVRTGPVREAEKQRGEAYAALLRTLEKPRFTGAVLNIAAWVESGKWLRRNKARIQAARGETVEARAASALERRWKRVRKRAAAIEDIDDGQRHRLRMRIKTLRYGVEFFAGTFPERQAEQRRRALLKILQNLQDELGEMNDIATAKSRFPALPRPEPGETERRLGKLLSQARGASHRLQVTEPFWRGTTPSPRRRKRRLKP